MLGTWLAQGGPTTKPTDLRANPRLRPALERIARYGQSLFLLRGSHATTHRGRTCARWSRRIDARRRDRPLVVFVDYLQRVPGLPGAADTEAEKVTTVVAGIKDLALSLGVADGRASSPPTRKA